RPQPRHRDCRRSAEKNATFGAALHDGQRASLSDLRPVKQLAVQVFSRDSGTIDRPEKSRKNATPECQNLSQPDFSFRWPFGSLPSNKLQRLPRREPATVRLSNRI